MTERRQPGQETLRIFSFVSNSGSMTGFFFFSLLFCLPSARRPRSGWGCRAAVVFTDNMQRSPVKQHTTKLMYNLIRNSYSESAVKFPKYRDGKKEKLKESKKLTRRIRPIYNPSCFHFAVYTHTHRVYTIYLRWLYTHTEGESPSKTCRRFVAELAFFILFIRYLFILLFQISRRWSIELSI